MLRGPNKGRSRSDVGVASLPNEEKIKKELETKKKKKEEEEEEKKTIVITNAHETNHARSTTNRLFHHHNKNSNNNNNNLSTSKTRNYGIVLHGCLKTRYIDIKHSNKKSLFTLKSSWKLRYWRLSLTDDGLILEKSRRADTRPYKGIFLPFGKTAVWENWGKRGDNKYCFGFTLRVACIHMQMEAAVDSRTVRSRWLNVLQSAFCSNVQDTKELVKYLAQKASDRLSKMTDAGDQHCAKSRPLQNLQSTKYSSGSEASTSWEGPNTGSDLLANVNQAQVNTHLSTDTISVRAHTYTRTETNRSGWYQSANEDYDLARDDNIIPRRYNANLYDHEGHMSDVDTLHAIQMDCELDSIDNNKRNRGKRRDTSPLVEMRSKPKNKRINQHSMEIYATSSLRDLAKPGDTMRSDSCYSLGYDAAPPTNTVDGEDGHSSHVSHTAFDILNENPQTVYRSEIEQIPSPSELKEKRDSKTIDDQNANKRPNLPIAKSE